MEAKVAQLEAFLRALLAQMNGNEAPPNTIITTVLTFPPPKPIDVKEGDLKNKIDFFEK
jgi:hypothetical protein